jgi:hypothetical protein
MYSTKSALATEEGSTQQYSLVVSEIAGNLLGNLSNYCCHFHAAAAAIRLSKFFAIFGKLHVESHWYGV